jgi:hypothetical protein
MQDMHSVLCSARHSVREIRMDEQCLAKSISFVWETCHRKLWRGDVLSLVCGERVVAG